MLDLRRADSRLVRNLGVANTPDDPELTDEPARLAALRRYDVLDTPAEEPFDKLTALVRSILNVPMSAVTLVDAERQWFKSRPGLGVAETRRDISFCTHTIQRHEPLIIKDAKTDPRFSDSPLVTGPPFIGSYAGVPLRTPDGYNVGALCAIDTVPRTFSANQIEILERFAALVIDELELRQIAQKDFLTGIMSRRAFVNEVEREISFHRRHHRAHSLIMFDVDHFKSVNNRFGHPAGDRVLQEVVARASAELRIEDCIGRVGGEEFAILVSGSSAQGGLALAERVRLSLAAQPVMLDEPLAITASFGIAAMADATKDAADWMAAADAALYRAKKEGRNRCVTASAP